MGQGGLLRSRNCETASEHGANSSPHPLSITPFPKQTYVSLKNQLTLGMAPAMVPLVNWDRNILLLSVNGLLLLRGSAAGC